MSVCACVDIEYKHTHTSKKIYHIYVYNIYIVLCRYTLYMDIKYNKHIKRAPAARAEPPRPVKAYTSMLIH